MLYIIIADSFCFTEQHRKMSSSELDPEMKPEWSRGRGATLKPGIMRYDLKTKLRPLFAGCQLILLQLDDVHFGKGTCELKLPEATLKSI